MYQGVLASGLARRTFRFSRAITWAALAVLVALCLGGSWFGVAVKTPLAFADEIDGIEEELAVVEEAELSEEEKEAKRKAEEALATYEQAFAAVDAAWSMLSGLPELQAQLAAYPETLAQAQHAVEEADALYPPLEVARKKALFKRLALIAQQDDLEKKRAEAIYHLAITDEELALSTYGISLVSVVLGEYSITEAESAEYLLERVASSHVAEKEKQEEALLRVAQKLQETQAAIEDIEAQIEEVKAQKAEAEQAWRVVVEEGNTVAFSIEKLAAEARQATKEPIATVEALDSAIEGVGEMKAAAEGWDLRTSDVRAQALAEAGAWYDAVDALVGLKESITYGEGLDFALSQEDFIAKWGPAIDAFFEAQAAPLQGQGKTMAKYAYIYKVDPRLCAAVSIVESSGGKYCIKPHNAWGWGAADSDPYNLAFSWKSWDEAIEAWHKGMATSQSGLATASSLTAMGDIYCSTPIWGSKVASLMEQVASYV